MRGAWSEFGFAAAVLLALSATANAAPIFYLSDLPLGTATPGILDKYHVFGEAGGQFGIYVTTDVRLSGVSLELIEVGGGIRFTDFTIVNNGRWAFLDGPKIVEPSRIRGIGGAAFPFGSGTSIGPGSSELPDPNSGYLFATVDYEATGFGVSELYLRVGSNLIADWEGKGTSVIFGPGSSPVWSENWQATDSIREGYITNTFIETSEIEVSGNGVIVQIGDDTPSLIDNTDFGTIPLGSTQQRTFEVKDLRFGTNLDPPVITGPFSLVGDFPVFVNSGETKSFTLAVNASTPGTYFGEISFANNNPRQNPFTFSLAAHVIPEPASWLMAAAALALGLMSRRRATSRAPS